MNIKRIISILILYSFTTMTHAGRIHEAVKRGDLEELKALLTDQSAVPLTKEGESLLHLAVRYDHTEIVQFLIDMGLLKNSRIQEEFFGPIGRPRKIVSSRFPKKDPEEEIIQNAVMKGERGTVEKLLDKRPDLIQVRTDEGESLIHLAARYECHEITQDLLRRGALRYEVDQLFQPCKYEDEEEEPEKLFQLKFPIPSLSNPLKELRLVFDPDSLQRAFSPVLLNIKSQNIKPDNLELRQDYFSYGSQICYVMNYAPINKK